MNNTKTAAFSVGTCFGEGMTRYALNSRTATVQLAKLAASVSVGIFIGVICRFLVGETVNVPLLSEDYIHTRAFSSYAELSTYMRFFADWFTHHGWWLLAVLPLSLTLYPTAALHLLCMLRGVCAGFSVCCLSGGFSVFAVCYAAMQGALCVFLIMACVKGICYAARRQALPRGSLKQFSIPFLCGDTAPFLCGISFALSAQGLGMLLVSGIASLVQTR